MIPWHSVVHMPWSDGSVYWALGKLALDSWSRLQLMRVWGWEKLWIEKTGAEEGRMHLCHEQSLWRSRQSSSRWGLGFTDLVKVPALTHMYFCLAGSLMFCGYMHPQAS